MKKLSKEILDSFRSDITSILSPERLKSFDGDIQNYYDNRLLALRVGHKIAEIEIYLRNMLDFCLKEIGEGENWIKNAKSLKHIKQKARTSFQELTPSQILSNLMLGEVVDLIGEYEIRHYMFDLHHLDFKKYHWSNNNFFKINNKKTFFSNVSKVEISLNLIRSIRNRCFHWENLLKTRIIKDKIYPRIATIYPKDTERKNQTIIGVMPDKIIEFLDDLLACINNQMMKKFQDIEIRYRKI